MKRVSFSILGLLFLMGSCRVSKDVTYFQGLENITDEQKAAMNQKYVPRICIDDELIIYVSAPDRTSVAPFSPPPFGYYAPNEATVGISATTQNLFTYLVDEEGTINFPVLGRLEVAGLSVNEAIRMLEGLVRESAPKAIVNIQISNFKVGIYGEVKNADLYTITTPRISVLELIAKAGDLTITADRKNVWLTRDNNGEKIHVKMDLTDPAIFASPYYYLQQNDMVYVQPNKAQKRNANVSEGDMVTVSFISAFISGVSAIFTALLVIKGRNIK